MLQYLAIYLRVSSEDYRTKSGELADESNSIRVQRMLIDRFINADPELSALPVLEFSDDGFSGTNFDRPGVQKLLGRVRKGEIACIVVKDLSRFGRNYLEAGDYLERVFPLLGVRFIGITDQYDSNRFIGSTGGIDVAFRNLVYQRYAQDLSEKIKSSRHMQMRKGTYFSHCPYGYIRDSNNKRRMAIDPVAGPVVREIFMAAIDGMKSTEIAAMLNDLNIMTPMTYKKWARAECHTSDVMWSHQAVLRILKDYKYTGAMVTFKCGNETVRARSQKRYKPEDWVVIEGCHDPIVSVEEYNRANETIRKVRHTLPTKTDCKDRVYICSCCGRRLRKTYGLDEYFSCQTQLYQKDAECASTYWSRSDLESTLLAAYRIQLALMDNELRKQMTKPLRNPVDECRKRQQQLTEEISGYDGKNLNLYEQYRAGKFTKEEFLAEKRSLLSYTEGLREQLRQLQVEEAELLEQRQTDQERKLELKKASALSELPDEKLKPIMFEAIDHVLVHPSRELEILWKFADVTQRVKEEIAV